MSSRRVCICGSGDHAEFHSWPCITSNTREAVARAMTEPTDWRGGPDGDYWLMRADRVLALLGNPTTDPVVGYVIAERQVSGPRAGKLDADWDGEVHETLEAALAELARANRPGEGETEPGDWWRLYELREVTS